MNDHRLTRNTLLLTLGLAAAGSLTAFYFETRLVAGAVIPGILISGGSSLIFLNWVKWALLKKDKVFMVTVFGNLLGRFLVVCLALCLYLVKLPGMVPAFLTACLGSYLVFLIFEIRVFASGMDLLSRKRPHEA